MPTYNVVIKQVQTYRTQVYAPDFEQAQANAKRIIWHGRVADMEPVAEDTYVDEVEVVDSL